MSVLIDANLLIGLAVEDHEHHESAARWFATRAESGTPTRFATCPITQGAVIRHLVRHGQTMETGLVFLTALAQRDDHEFWADDIQYPDVPAHGVIGHRQVTDAYLAQLARRRAGRIATLDRGFASVHPDVVDLVPTS